MQKIPATVITGFLGSGKTTLLRHLIEQAQGLRLAVLVNEFGELGIDGELLRCPLRCDGTDTNDGTIPPVFELANGCICCTVQEEFFPVMKQLVSMRSQIDHILIETSGLALPKPLVQAFQWPEIKTHCTVDAVISVVDCPAVSDGIFADDPDAIQKQRNSDASLDHESSLAELFHDQVHTADMIILNKTDLLEQDALFKVRQSVAKQTRDGVHIVEAEFGKLPPEMIIGLDKSVENYIDDIHNHHDHDDHHDHNHDAFESVIIRFGELDKSNLQNLCEQLVCKHPILRLKGIVAVPGKSMRMVAQGVGKRFEYYFDRTWQANEDRRSILVAIGQQMDEHAINRDVDRFITQIHAST